MPSEETANPMQLKDHAIIAGFGVPGRAFAEWMTIHKLPYVVIEQNETIVERCGRTGTSIIAGDIRNEQTLLAAGITRAKLLALTVPIESVVLEATAVARKLNPTMRIIARLQYISAGLDAIRRGADEAVVAEELAAREFVRLLDGGRSTIRSNVDGVHRPVADPQSQSATPPMPTHQDRQS
jgi:voltage-gated potassium channel Kch